MVTPGSGYADASIDALRMKKPDSRLSVSRSASRAFDILEYFGQARRPCRAIEIARALDLHPSSANQLLKTLLESGHLVFDAQGKTYLPSPRLIGFSTWMTTAYGAEDRFRSILQDVHAATGAVVTLSTPNDLFMQILDVAGTADWALSARRGLHVSLFGSAALGNAYLSMLADKEIERLYERARLPRQMLPRLMTTISRVRREGFAEGVTANGSLRSIGVPLSAGTAVPMVIALADRAERIQTDRASLHGEIRNAINRGAATCRLPRG